MTKKEQDTNPEDDSVENVHEEPIQRENEEVVRGEKDRWRSIIAFTVNFVVYEDIFHDNFPHFDTTFSIQEHRVHFKAGVGWTSGSSIHTATRLGPHLAGLGGQI